MNIAVIIPSLNASESLPELLKRTAASIPNTNIIVINDGSNDDTGMIAERAGVNVITHDHNRGKGAALQSGFDYALKKNVDAVITMDADLQHQPEEIPNFIAAYRKTGSDVIIGSRLHNTQGMPFHRFLSNTLTTALVRLRTGSVITDSQSGFRFISRNVLEKVRLEATGFEAETELLIKASQLGCTFSSIPIKTIYAGEKSSMTHIRTTVNFLKTLLRRY